VLPSISDFLCENYARPQEMFILLNKELLKISTYNSKITSFKENFTQANILEKRQT
jgi:hypothetical protein